MSVTDQQPTLSEKYGVNYDALPEHMRSGARLYIEDGIPPGDFMLAILTNDLKGAFGRADEINRSLIETWIRWTYNDIPGGAQGSVELVQAWMNARGLHQFEAQVPA